MAKFKPRTTRPEKGNKYYIRQVSGGWNGAVQGKPKDKYCDVLSNCVGYATIVALQKSLKKSKYYSGTINGLIVN